MRTKVFLSYSHANADWRERFCKHLKTMFPVGETLWEDYDGLPGGVLWEKTIREALAESRCALVLLTPSYLDLDPRHFARKEFEIVVAEQAKGLVLLPVLVERCAWNSVPSLSPLQFVRWRNVVSTDVEAPILRDVGDGDDDAIDRAVLEICQQVGKTMGVVGQTTAEQRDLLFEATDAVLEGRVRLDRDTVHSGDFSVVYSGTLEGDRVAVKSVPDAPRQNRIRMVFDQAVESAKKLTDPAFIRVRYANSKREPHCLVMDYLAWPTLETRLATQDGRRLAPAIVVKILRKIASAQRDAHNHDFSVGPLAAANIHADETWDVRLSPIRIEGQMARAAAMATGQLLNWDALTHLTPEVSEGHSPRTPEERDMQGQYYLGLLALELLLGQRPFEVRCFDDLMQRPAFFDDPRSFFERTSVTWIDQSPALAFLLARMLARDPKSRLPPDTTVEELEAVTGAKLPAAVLRQLDDDYDTVQCKPFATRFYQKLFALRPDLAALFPNVEGQAEKFASALQSLIDFRPEAKNSRFRLLAARHARFNIGDRELIAFRTAFIQQVSETFAGSQQHADAWNAAFARSIGAMQIAPAKT